MMGLLGCVATFALGNYGAVKFDIARAGTDWYLLLLGQPYLGGLLQCLVSLILIYAFRQLERHMSSRAFCGLLFVNLCLTILFEMMLLSILLGMGLKVIPSAGPFFYLLGLLPMYYSHIPTLRGTSLLGGAFTFSEKSQIYILAAQLLFSDGLSSVIPGAAAILAGRVYMFAPLRLNKFRFPAAVCRACGFAASFFVSLSPLESPYGSIERRQAAVASGGAAERVVQPTGARRAGGGGVPMGYGGGGGPMMGAAAEPSVEAVQALVSMGFDETAVRNALRATGNNPDAAANMLLSG